MCLEGWAPLSFMCWHLSYIFIDGTCLPPCRSDCGGVDAFSAQDQCPGTACGVMPPTLHPQPPLQANKALLESQRRQQASLAKKRLLLETRIRKMTAELDRGSPDLIRVREELSRGAKRLASLQKQLEEGRHGVEEQRARHAALERQLESLNDGGWAGEVCAWVQRGRVLRWAGRV